MTGVAWWSQTAANNATYDPSLSWAEGMAPSSVNDSARAMMASTKKWADDIAGATVTGGSSTAYTLSTFQSFDTLARLNGQVVGFTPHATNGATVTLNVDGLGAKPLRSAPSLELPAGVIVQGTPYVAVYNSSDAAFYLQNFYGNPYNVPIGGIMPYAGATAPNSNFVLPHGQAISRTTYPAAFSLMGTTYGSGDGSTTFNVPDLRGRVVAGVDTMGGSAAGRLTDITSGFGDVLGETGGAQSVTLTASQIPSITSTVSTSGTLTGQTNSFLVVQNTSTTGGGGFTLAGSVANQNIGVSVSGSMSGSATSNNTGGGAHGNVQPTIVLNYLLRII
ncbi:microcystin-dependent protein [Bradyrhizobium yuanmingense]|uniref:phage tail protein n=1 Tax=Bradyrhizobium yuanmingense TaxID=108015 RepID=UPI0004AFC18D|nr:tail fiber protein [Bradyrhizobium yuanmingense]